MQHPFVIAACLAALVLLGICERVARDRARRAVSIRIHVNGTRGKSTVTRLIAGALREAGIPTVAKTTGTAARILLPDGEERPVRRRAPPNIREQLWLLREARRAGARAVVAECMAIQPELQRASEHAMLSSAIGVITNVRLDHTDVMGRTIDEIAESLANTTPAGGTLVVGGRTFLPVFENRAAALGTKVVVAEPAAEAGSGQAAWEDGNRAVALAVARILGISDRVALDGMRKARPDPGAVSVGTFRIGVRDVSVVEASAANDPESLEMILAGLAENPSSANSANCADMQPDLSSWVAVYNHRDDRALRLRSFADASAVVRRAGHLIMTGDRPCRSLVARVQQARGGRPVSFCKRRRVTRTLAQVLSKQPETAGVVFCGNTKGLEVRSIVGGPTRVVRHG